MQQKFDLRQNRECLEQNFTLNKPCFTRTMSVCPWQIPCLQSSLCPWELRPNLLQQQRQYLQLVNTGWSSLCHCVIVSFQTGNGPKVHTDLEHTPHQSNKAELKCKKFCITCSYLIVMNKHILQEHKFRCTQCPETLKKSASLKFILQMLTK